MRFMRARISTGRTASAVCWLLALLLCAALAFSPLQPGAPAGQDRIVAALADGALDDNFDTACADDGPDFSLFARTAWGHEAAFAFAEDDLHASGRGDLCSRNRSARGPPSPKA